MKAMVLHGVGQPLKLEEMPKPKPGPNGVLIRVRACGIGLRRSLVKSIPSARKSSAYRARPVTFAT